MTTPEQANNLRYSLNALKGVMPELMGLPQHELKHLRRMIRNLEKQLAAADAAIAAKGKQKQAPDLSTRKGRDKVFKAIDKKHKQIREASIKKGHRASGFSGWQQRVPGSAFSNER